MTVAVKLIKLSWQQQQPQTLVTTVKCCMCSGMTLPPDGPPVASPRPPVAAATSGVLMWNVNEAHCEKKPSQ